MILGILKEINDRRVAMVPQVAAKFSSLGAQILIESGAGAEAGYRDSDYEEHARVASREKVLQEADMLVFINKPESGLLDKIPADRYVVSSFAPFIDDQITDDLKRRQLHAFSLDMIPRTTLAQSMDVLSSMTNIAGYKAVLKAADHLGKYFPMLITAAGSIKPAKVLVIGAGVAGLQAVATARRLGAVVEVFDTRQAVKEEVQSLGARFVEVEGAADDGDAGGYAVEQSEEYMRRQRELVQEKARSANVIITTAQVRGRKAPVIIPAETVEQMAPGSVIVDLAASTGGNCALTEDNKIIQRHGVTIIGDSDLAEGMPRDASFLFANNILNYLKLIISEGEITVNMEDEIVRESLITK
jgi:NAD(P) transhydrogenase subunit alpha